MKLREKYSKNEDTVETSSKEEKKPKMSYQEVWAGQMLLINPICGWVGWLNPKKVREIQETVKYYIKHPDEVKNNAQAAS